MDIRDTVASSCARARPLILVDVLNAFPRHST